MKNYVIVTAGGVGSRTKQFIPKQFLSVNDMPIIIYTLLNLEKHPEIDKIVVACLDGWESYLLACCKQFNISKLYKVVKGGASGFESITNGLEALKEVCEDDDIVIIHDGNRPCTSHTNITDCIATAKEKGSAISAIPTNEVVYEIDDNKQKLLDRDKIFRTQTPHAANFKLIYELYGRAKKEGFVNGVAFCSILTHYNMQINFVRGSEKNFKITYKDEIDMFKGLIKIGETGVNYDL